MGVPFADFIAPGLIVMAMLQNASPIPASRLLVGKIQGNIVDYLMPPLSTGELIAGLVGAAVTRAFLVGGRGVAGDAAVARRPCRRAPTRCGLLWFGLMGSLMLAFLGLMTSIWADKFDHAAMVTNFVVTPLSLLSGTFYSVHQLSPAFQRGQPRQPLLLRHLGLPRTASSGSAIRRCWSAAGAARGSTWRCARSAMRCCASGWKIKNWRLRLPVRVAVSFLNRLVGRGPPLAVRKMNLRQRTEQSPARAVGLGEWRITDAFSPASTGQS